MMFKVSRVETKPIDGQKPGSSGLRKKRLLQQQLTQYPTSEELSIGKIKFKAFDLGGHQIAHRVWKDYYAKVGLYQRGDQFVLTAFNKGLNTWASWVDQNVNPSKTYKVDEFESYYASKPKLEAAFFFKTSCNSKRCL